MASRDGKKKVSQCRKCLFLLNPQEKKLRPQFSSTCWFNVFFSFFSSSHYGFFFSPFPPYLLRNLDSLVFFLFLIFYPSSFVAFTLLYNKQCRSFRLSVQLCRRSPVVHASLPLRNLHSASFTNTIFPSFRLPLDSRQ